MAQGRAVRHPVMREALWERREFLRTLGLSTAGLLAAACSGNDPDPAGVRRLPTEKAAASVRPYDPAVVYWEQGNFAAVDQQLYETALDVTGAIPSDLSGLYLRNGSNPITKTSPHWILGDGMVHGVRIEQGRARWYRNRWVDTQMLRERKDYAHAGVPGGPISQSNVSVIHHAGRLLSLGEAGGPYELSPDDLSTIGPYDFAGQLTSWMTAHPKVDPSTGLMHFFGYGALPAIDYHVADPSGQIVHSEKIPVDVPSMIHDFAITDRDVVFWRLPIVLGFDPGGRLPGFPFHWDPNGPSQVGVMPLGGPASAIRWVGIDPCWVFHGLNAHRDGDTIVLRVLPMESAFSGEDDFLPPHLTEWRIGTGGDQLTFESEQISDHDMEMPTIDRRLTGRPSRHGWFLTHVHDEEYGFEPAGICHRDGRSGRETVWEPGVMERPGEALFVPTGTGEDEGWLLSYLYDRTVDRSSLGIFDAMAVADGPVARIHLPARVPYGFHGLWLDEELLA